MRDTYVKLVETRIDVADLEIGMHVIRLDRPWEETDFLMQGFIIKDLTEVHALRHQCDFVIIQGVAEEKRKPTEKVSNCQRTLKFDNKIGTYANSYPPKGVKFDTF